jgi:hypothetical protein
VLFREETVEFEQDRRHVYRLINPPSPAKDYHGDVTFTPNAAGGTDIRWVGSFTEGMWGSGPVMRAALRATINIIANRLVKVAESAQAKDR